MGDLATKRASLLANHNATPTPNSVVSGTYSPTVSSASNMTVSNPTGACQFMRVGNVVTVSGNLDNGCDPAAGTASFQLSLPIARTTNFATNGLGSGAGIDTGSVTPQTVWLIQSQNGTKNVTFRTTNAGNPSNQDVNFRFTYLTD